MPAPASTPTAPMRLHELLRIALGAACGAALGSGWLGNPLLGALGASLGAGLAARWRPAADHAGDSDGQGGAPPGGQAAALDPLADPPWAEVLCTYLPDALVITERATGRLLWVNPGFERMTGWAPHEALGRTALDLGLWVNPADRLVWMMALRREGRPLAWSGRFRRHDGQEMVVQLACQVAPLQGHEVVLIAARDITEEARAQRLAESQRAEQAAAQARALTEARDAAEAASRAKSQFLARASHEIRTPLSALLGLAGMARDPGLDDLRRRRYIELLCDSAEALSRILSNILDFSRIEAGRLSVQPQPFDLPAQLDPLGGAFSALADARGLQMEVSLAPQLPHIVVGDWDRLRQILVNFLHNALKFTREGGVHLVVEPAAGDRVRFEVHDTGPGIDAATCARLFQPFVQAQGPQAVRAGGFGLGLSICRELAQLMGGEVGVDSQPGQGSCFWLELPLPAADAATTQSSGLTLMDGQPLQGVHVLVAEDNAVNMLIVAAMLEGWGAEVTQVGDGAQAVAAVREAARRGQPVDLVLMDLQMPEMDGLAATRRLRLDWTHQQLPIVALTAAALQHEQDEALAAGMDGFLTKPIDPPRTRQMVMRLLGLPSR
ncbi:ATP-binding protein [Ideonella livida]|uniref:Virulence sensor protein BvgS n=1 Tax=Ideonella livida TaxID=2707176 RepID=A0A7C9TM02_9BURK|nr:ATP-binding protein [Ideonella livida]NDY92962.1 response regulator [Ideonella livida]